MKEYKVLVPYTQWVSGLAYGKYSVKIKANSKKEALKNTREIIENATNPCDILEFETFNIDNDELDAGENEWELGEMEVE
jgi:hypothetical protein